MRIVVSGVGVVSPIGVGIAQFKEALKAGKSNFSLVALEHLGNTYTYPGALADSFDYKKTIDQLEAPETVKRQAKRLRNISMGAGQGVCAAIEAWQKAGLFDALPNPDKAAIVAGGSNTQQASLVQIQERYREKLKFLNPTYGFNFLDTDIIGALSQLLNIKGEGQSIGGASASGNMALIQASRLIESGAYDVVLALAPSMEPSIYEYQGFTALGAMAVLTADKKIESLCNPFDKSHCGFVYGQNAGAIVLESAGHAQKRKASILAEMLSYGCSMDANRNPNPSAEGEAKAMQKALNKAEIGVDQIDYINTHGTASVIGDQTEVEAILAIGGKGVKVNATKGLIGHGISSAGLVEAITCIIQMNERFLHPNPHLINPISEQLDWVQETLLEVNLEYCMTNSFGFGGLNTSIVLKNLI